MPCPEPRLWSIVCAMPYFAPAPACLALPRLALPCPALPCPALPCLDAVPSPALLLAALLCLNALPCLNALSCLNALPCSAVLLAALPHPFMPCSSLRWTPSAQNLLLTTVQNARRHQAQHAAEGCNA